jgi:tyrosinase
VYRVELALRSTGHDVMLPWWDWATVQRIPPQYKPVAGQQSPLSSMPISEVARQQGKRGEGTEGQDSEELRLAQIPNTTREPGRPGTHLPSAGDIEHVMAYRDFASFTTNLEDFHGAVHMWVGGHMGDIPFAAYDPIFWAHHCMIDRIWRMWQLRHTQASFPENVAKETMEPFNLTAHEVLDPTTLGYDYVMSSTAIPVGG